MTSSPADLNPPYSEWKAPVADGQILIWPQPDEILQQTRQNHESLSRCESARIQNVPLRRLRQLTRESIGHANDEQPLLATGHQSELYHPGVWVKDVLIHNAAARVDGRAYHFSVDTDSPKHLHVRWPGESHPITDDPAVTTAAWSGLLASPTAEHLRELHQAARRASAEFGFESTLPAFLDAMRRRVESGSAPRDLPTLLTAAQRDLDGELGLVHAATMVSPMLSSRGYLAFAHHILAHADAFATSYNAALADYRRRTGSTSSMRPMPDLFVGDQSIESPFWLDDLSRGTRTRPSAFRDSGGHWMLKLVSGDEYSFDPKTDAMGSAERLAEFLEQTAHRLSPRALTFTMFLRLLVVDQFVHGIGGGRYDQVADQIIATHFGLTPPPPFSVTTGTLYFPTAVERDRVCMPCILQEGHHLTHSVLGGRKQEFVSRIASAPRQSSERASLFLEMHNERRAAVAESELVRRWVQKLRDAVRCEQEEQVLFDRELFYAVQSRDRLQLMISKYAAAFAGNM